MTSATTAPLMVTRGRPAADRWTLHELSDPRFVIWEKPRGAGRFRVIECGTGARGMGRLRGTAGTLPAALELAGSLNPSTPAEILADITPFGDRDRDRIAELTALGQP